VVPRLPDMEPAAAAQDEDTVVRLEGAVAEWSAQLAQVLQREAAARVLGTGALQELLLSRVSWAG